MAPFPINLGEALGHWNAYIVYFVIGIGFGIALELGGFGNSKKLAAQFYFKDMTVIKVMFTGIVVAMVLIFGASAVGLLDYELLWVNPTYLWPGIVGGLVMGVGFIVGGFCPGTSVVSAATGKIDGIFFVGGVLTGIFFFGETVGLYEDFWYSSNMGRFTLPELFNLDTGWVVLGVVLMAIFVFWGSEKLEGIFGGMDTAAFPKWRYAAAGGLAAFAVVFLVIGQPDADSRWAQIGPEKEQELSKGTYQIHPGELLELMNDPGLRVTVLDVRNESDYNTFHIIDSTHVRVDELSETLPMLQSLPNNAVTVLVSNTEADFTAAWKTLVAEGIPNVYILGGGINTWLETFAEDHDTCEPLGLALNDTDDVLNYRFMAGSLGDRYEASNPDSHEYVLVYEKKVELELNRGPLGSGCGN